MIAELMGVVCFLFEKFLCAVYLDFAELYEPILIAHTAGLIDTPLYAALPALSGFIIFLLSPRMVQSSLPSDRTMASFNIQFSIFISQCRHLTTKIDLLKAKKIGISNLHYE